MHFFKLKKIINGLKWQFAGIMGKLFIDLFFCTTKIDIIGYKKIRPIHKSGRYIYAFWHSRLLVPLYLGKGKNGVAMVSSSDDGEIIARILQYQGNDSVRGSTSRGGARVLAKHIRLLKQRKRPGAVIPDGPRGPKFKVQPGIIAVAKKTGYNILPISYSAKKRLVLNSWDRFIIPCPFTRCRVVYGNPVYVPHNSTKKEEELYRIHLENELIRITKEADNYFDHKIS